MVSGKGVCGWVASYEVELPVSGLDVERLGELLLLYDFLREIRGSPWFSGGGPGSVQEVLSAWNGARLPLRGLRYRDGRVTEVARVLEARWPEIRAGDWLLAARFDSGSKPGVIRLSGGGKVFEDADSPIREVDGLSLFLRCVRDLFPEICEVVPRDFPWEVRRDGPGGRDLVVESGFSLSC